MKMMIKIDVNETKKQGHGVLTDDPLLCLLCLKSVPVKIKVSNGSKRNQK